MAATEPLLVHQNLDTTTQEYNRISSRKRRFRRCKSAPRAELDPVDDAKQDGPQPPPPVQYLSIIGNLSPSFRRIFALLAIYLGVGTICFYLVRDQTAGKKTNGVLDAVYFCIVTMTTVGYGDLVPNSVPSKLLACAFVFSGMVLVGHILSRAADYLVEKQEALLFKAIHMRQRMGPPEILKEIQTNKALYKCYTTFAVLMFLVLAGTIFLTTIEKMDFVDAFYCVCSTITTLGYGDASFDTKTGRVFAVFWILTSTVCLAQFLLYVAEYNTEKRQRALVKWVLTRRTTNTDLEAADLDDDGVVGAAEFIIFKLKEMGKISQEDVSVIMDEFEQLDFDESGTLTVSDFTLAQSSK